MDTEIIVHRKVETIKEEGVVRERTLPDVRITEESSEIDRIMQELKNSQEKAEETQTRQSICAVERQDNLIRPRLDVDAERALVWGSVGEDSVYAGICDEVGMRRFRTGKLRRELRGNGGYFVEVEDKFRQTTERVYVSEGLLKELLKNGMKRKTEFAELMANANDAASRDVKESREQSQQAVKLPTRSWDNRVCDFINSTFQPAEPAIIHGSSDEIDSALTSIKKSIVLATAGCIIGLSSAWLNEEEEIAKFGKGKYPNEKKFYISANKREILYEPNYIQLINHPPDKIINKECGPKYSSSRGMLENLARKI